MHLLIALLSLGLIASVSSQKVAGVCSQADMDLGLYLKSHETYCDLYYQCTTDLSAHVMACNPGLLFDDVSRVCSRPELATCPNKQCNPGDDLTMWPHACCDSYVGCRYGQFYVGRCEGPNQQFDQQRRGCVSAGTTGTAVCQNNLSCPRRAASVGVQPVRCMLRAIPNDRCKFDTVDDLGNSLGIQSCAAGTSFNDSTCNCGTLDPTCGAYTPTAVENRRRDPQCRATMVLDFSSEQPSSYTMKTSSGQRAINSYAIGAHGYRAANTEGIFSSDLVGTKPWLYFWSFARNMLLGPFGIRMSFRVDNPQEGYSFALITNDMSSLRADCEGTLDIRVTYQSGRWVIRFKVMGYNARTGQMTNVQDSAQTPAFANGYITVSLMFSRDSQSISGFVISQGSNPVPWGPVNLGADQIAINSCGLALGYGLEGRLNEAKFYEACGDEDILRSHLQTP